MFLSLSHLSPVAKVPVDFFLRRVPWPLFGQEKSTNKQGSLVDIWSSLLAGRTFFGRKFETSAELHETCKHHLLMSNRTYSMFFVSSFHHEIVPLTFMTELFKTQSSNQCNRMISSSRCDFIKYNSHQLCLPGEVYTKSRWLAIHTYSCLLSKLTSLISNFYKNSGTYVDTTWVIKMVHSPKLWCCSYLFCY